MSIKPDLKVYIADDHTIFRKAMVSLLQSFERVASVKDAENGKELLALVKESQPDIVLLDLQMPVMDGSETCEQLYNKYPDVRVIVLSMHDSERYVLHMMDLGARAFLFKNVEPDELEAAIYSVADKDFYHNEFIASILRKSLREKHNLKRPDFNPGLSERELEVLRLICEEYSTKEISSRLSLSDRTVENHRARIMEKIGVKNIVGVVRYAYESGLLT
ncbi:DNA-binding response regulator [Chryseotalea sanaruensis]|jgi:DNA-binding NarL/FixJ family response regulator|uniref:DNA-binding response regulator n=1 Tax=Chryseotalea sanaruensis TaxID=2482724 RepID=A0A401U8E2_9BACT|nr:response regulator transcription factor [Chryseotalea sanaruensis]GCC51146.1 DNA-binding response regulator [Chryseotalea sanaruensis]